MPALEVVNRHEDLFNLAFFQRLVQGHLEGISEIIVGRRETSLDNGGYESFE